MIAKLKSLWTLFQKGKMVANPAKWKARQITSSMVVALLWAAVHAAEAFGLDLQVGSETVDAVAVGVLALVNWVLTLTTSDKVGMSPKPKPDT